jgi:hypothetical protein
MHKKDAERDVIIFPLPNGTGISGENDDPVSRLPSFLRSIFFASTPFPPKFIALPMASSYLRRSAFRHAAGDAIFYVLSLLVTLSVRRRSALSKVPGL